VKRSDNHRKDGKRPFKRRVHVWAEKIRVKPKQIRVQPMSHKWASCSTRGWVTFSVDLLNQSKKFQDYVIVHELVHLKVPNHGKLFKSLLSVHLPEWRKIKSDALFKNRLERKLAG
jgi:predicted metal-dependent hydrolase